MIKFLAIFFLVIYLASLIAKWAIKRWLRNFSRQQSGNYHQKPKTEGEVFVNYNPTEDKLIQKDDGDYVDYEDVK